MQTGPHHVWTVCLNPAGTQQAFKRHERIKKVVLTNGCFKQIFRRHTVCEKTVTHLRATRAHTRPAVTRLKLTLAGSPACSHGRSLEDLFLTD